MVSHEHLANSVPPAIKAMWLALSSPTYVTYSLEIAELHSKLIKPCNSQTSSEFYKPYLPNTIITPLTPEGPRIHGLKMTNSIDHIVKTIIRWIKLYITTIGEGNTRVDRKINQIWSNKAQWTYSKLFKKS